MSWGRPPVPATHSLIGNDDGDLDWLYDVNDSNDFYPENFVANIKEDAEATLTVPTTMANGFQLPKPLQIFPPQTYTHTHTHIENNSAFVPSFDAALNNSPVSPISLSTPTQSPLSTHTSMSSPMSTVPSPISPSPQSSPPTVVPTDVKPIVDLKRVKVESTDGDQWEPYINNERTYYDLYNNNNVPITNSIMIRTRILANLEYNAIDTAYVMYRQNQFHLEIDFIGGGLLNYSSTSPTEPYYIMKQTPQGSKLTPVDGLYFYMYAVKHQRGQPFDSELVEINQSCGSRHSKEVQVPGLSSITSGRSSYSKLLFRTATAYNARSGKGSLAQPNPQQQFYRIVVALVAKIGDSLEFILTRISPCLLVRGQNPGRFKDNPIVLPATPVMISTKDVVVNPNTTYSPGLPLLKPKKEKAYKDKDKEKRATPKPKRKRTDSTTSEDSKEGIALLRKTETLHVQDGKVGINTSSPEEALTVHGNILVTGTIIKPSDQRIKTNIQPVSSASQLEKIKQIKIYDYELIHGKEPGSTGDKERGLLAQQLKEVLPNATRTLHDVTLADGEVIEELLVVEERALLYENIGATQELSDIVKQDQEKLQLMDQKIENRMQEESKATQQTLNAAGKLLDYMLTEKTEAERPENTLCCVMVTHTNKGFYGSVFSLGPAWTLFLAGLFIPPLWAFGALFSFSHNKSRKKAGIVQFVSFCVWTALFVMYKVISFFLDEVKYLVLFQASMGTIGLIVAAIRWHKRRSLRARKVLLRRQKEAGLHKRGLVQVSEGRPEYILQLTSESTKDANFMSIPMEALPPLDDIVSAVTTSPVPKSIIASARTKNASFAEEEWERRSLVRMQYAV